MEQRTRAGALRDAARERWGDSWILHTREYADGSTDLMVYHSRGLVETEAGAALERDRLLFDENGNIVHDRERVKKEERIETEVVSRDVDV